VEKYGPRKSGTLASFFFGLGIAGSGIAINANSILLLYLCYGVLGGIGLGVGYIAPVSTLVKWFPDRRGLATGLAIMGFGFASLISSPIIQRLTVTVGLANTFFLLGAVYFVVMFLSSQYLAPPRPGWMPKGYTQKPVLVHERGTQDDFDANEAVRTRRFYWLWLMLFINVTCGIAVISVASPMGQEVVGMTAYQAAAMVGLIGLFNGGGRIAWAALSDYIGRSNTYTAFFGIQLAAFFLLPKTSSALLFQGLLFLIMTCYGGGFACIPAFIGDLFGTKQLAAIHGYVLTAWAAAGLIGPIFAAWVRQTTGNYSGTLAVFLVLFVMALVISLLIRLDSRQPRREAAPRAKPSWEALAKMEERAFPAELDALPNVMDFITAHAQKAGLSAQKISRIQLAAEEAVANICHYAYLEEKAINLVNYPYHEPGRFTVRVRHEEATFEADLIDQGLAFNPLSVAPLDPTALLEHPELKGLGIHLIRQVTDEVRYKRIEEKNVLTLVMKKGL
jgi:OFA family oxalate/formate antiporter-like MFS transporter